MGPRFALVSLFGPLVPLGMSSFCPETRVNSWFIWEKFNLKFFHTWILVKGKVKMWTCELWILMANFEALTTPQNRPLIHISLEWGLWSWDPSKVRSRQQIWACGWVQVYATRGLATGSTWREMTVRLKDHKNKKSRNSFSLVFWSNLDGFYLSIRHFGAPTIFLNWPLMSNSLGWALWSQKPYKGSKLGVQHFSACLGENLNFLITNYKSQLKILWGHNRQ